jgi:hypothetical protein
MRFPVSFFRNKGGGKGTAIGSDSAPTTVMPGEGGGQATDCILACKRQDINGWPVQRIAVVWTTTAGSPVALNGSLYFWEDATQHWYLINATPLSMPPNQVVFFDIVTVAEPPPNAATLAQPGSPSQAGGIQVFLLVADPGTAVNGTYMFAMAPDLSTVGT